MRTGKKLRPEKGMAPEKLPAGQKTQNEVSAVFQTLTGNLFAVSDRLRQPDYLGEQAPRL